MAKAMPITRMAGRLLVIALHVAQVLLTVGGVGILFTRSSFLPISSAMFGSNAPLMNSAWLDMLMRPLLALPIAVLAGVFLYLRNSISSDSHRLTADIAYAAAMAGWISVLLLGLYGPVLTN